MPANTIEGMRAKSDALKSGGGMGSNVSPAAARRQWHGSPTPERGAAERRVNAVRQQPIEPVSRRNADLPLIFAKNRRWRQLFEEGHRHALPKLHDKTEDADRSAARYVQIVMDFLAEPGQRRKRSRCRTDRGQRMHLIRLLAARACFRMSTGHAMLARLWWKRPSLIWGIEKRTSSIHRPASITTELRIL
jgi:hypothetical protein